LESKVKKNEGAKREHGRKIVPWQNHSPPDKISNNQPTIPAGLLCLLLDNKQSPNPIMNAPPFNLFKHVTIPETFSATHNPNFLLMKTNKIRLNHNKCDRVGLVIKCDSEQSGVNLSQLDKNLFWTYYIDSLADTFVD